MFVRNEGGRLVIVHRALRSEPSRSAEVMGLSAHAEDFGEAGCLVALIDRFTQDMHAIEIEGEPYRDPKC